MVDPHVCGLAPAPVWLVVVADMAQDHACRGAADARGGVGAAVQVPPLADVVRRMCHRSGGAGPGLRRLSAGRLLFLLLRRLTLLLALAAAV